MRPSSIFATLSLAFACQACSDAPAYPEELAAVESFYSKLIEIYRAYLVESPPDWDELLEEHQLFEQWEDWRTAENWEQMFHIPNYPNETIVFSLACQEWQKRNASDSAMWTFRSAPLDSGVHVLASLPNAQELALRVTQTDNGWGIERLDLVFQEPLDRKASIEDFSLSFARRIFELERALPAPLVSDDKNDPDGPFHVFFSYFQQLRLVDSTHDEPYERRVEELMPFSSDASKWIGAQLRAWRNGWESQLSVYHVIPHDSSTEVLLELSFTQAGKEISRPEYAQFIVFKESSGWQMDIYSDWIEHSYFEFRRDVSGNWNYTPSKRSK